MTCAFVMTCESQKRGEEAMCAPCLRRALDATRRELAEARSDLESAVAFLDARRQRTVLTIGDPMCTEEPFGSTHSGPGCLRAAILGVARDLGWKKEGTKT